ncbi:jg8960 [Pararge aegeria aegeria]|uniref:Jg8960 protein n=1 Tax=Pararge aegeria aegeria TaxID=348720 RepID=A0A8S4SDH1_9NEOP|nr:jg8960 [Pararge aegeria aegeria]
MQTRMLRILKVKGHPEHNTWLESASTLSAPCGLCNQDADCGNGTHGHGLRNLLSESLPTAPVGRQLTNQKVGHQVLSRKVLPIDRAEHARNTSCDVSPCINQRKSYAV